MLSLSDFSEMYNNEADVDIQETLSISIDLMGSVTELSRN